MTDYKFIIDQPVEVEETRHYEFKEIKGGKPIDTVKNTCDEYVVAFLNSEGGRIFWGIRDSDRNVVGVLLTSAERDELRQIVTNKLNQIQPPISPTAYQVNIFSVYESENGDEVVENKVIIEIVAPRVFSSDLYSTNSGEVFVKTDSGKRKLTVPEITDEIRRRDSQKHQLSHVPMAEPEAFDKPAICVHVFINTEGLISNDHLELQASLAEALYAASNNEAIEFQLSYEALEFVNKAIASIGTDNISSEARLNRVELLKLVKRYEHRLEQFEEAALMLFQKPLRDYFYGSSLIADTIQGLATQIMSTSEISTDATGIDIFRKEGMGIRAVFYLNQEEVEEIKAKTDLDTLQFLAFGYDFSDLPHSVQYKKAIPAILLEVVDVKEKINSLDLPPLLNLNSWHIGLH